MGAFENAIREQETFESLLKLYKESRDQVAKLERENEELQRAMDEDRTLDSTVNKAFVALYDPDGAKGGELMDEKGRALRQLDRCAEYDVSRLSCRRAGLIREHIAELERENEALREDKARLDFLIEEDGAITHSDGKCSVHFGSGYAACFNDAREAIDAAKGGE